MTILGRLAENIFGVFATKSKLKFNFMSIDGEVLSDFY